MQRSMDKKCPLVSIAKVFKDEKVYSFKPSSKVTLRHNVTLDCFYAIWSCNSDMAIKFPRLFIPEDFNVPVDKNLIQ